MKPLLFKSPRLVFREWVITDAHWIYELNNDPEVLKYTGDVAFESLEEAESLIKNYDQYKNHGFGRWVVSLKDSNEPIGWCGFKYNEEELIDIGFRFFRKYWGNGYATEAAIATLNYGFDELHILEVVGRVAHDNLASIKVLEKVGMKYWKNNPACGFNDASYYKMRNPYM